MIDPQQPTVFVVDDDDAVRDSIYELVESVGLPFEGYRSALDFLEVLEPDRPGCLVLDVRMAEMSGLALQQQLNEMAITLPVIILTGHGDVPMAVAAMKNGALDFIQKPYREQALLDSINAALLKNAEDRRARSMDHILQARLATLTEREREVFEYLRLGDASKAIARKLAISPRTVETHRHNLLHKLAVSSVNELLALLAAQEVDN
ncbi:MAG: response regulator transcription factor [Pseudomonadales bacterium]|nr:response regulator transcription factor [Pseudomonadales bacterium]